MSDSPFPLLGLVAYSGTGKTTLLEQLIPLLDTRGIRCGLLKHAHHDFDIDTPGKDSYRLRQAGARQVMVASHKRWALMSENGEDTEPRLDELLPHFDNKRFDLLLVEGFKHEVYPKIALYRRALGKPPLSLDDSEIIAVASDTAFSDTLLPQLDINQPEQIARFIAQWLDERRRTTD
ncbi:MAG: molybdopterin-guanine dinucleotide biosynthesis protein MobB [Pseudomonadota bacterium]